MKSIIIMLFVASIASVTFASGQNNCVEKKIPESLLIKINRWNSLFKDTPEETLSALKDYSEKWGLLLGKRGKSIYPRMNHFDSLCEDETYTFTKRLPTGGQIKSNSIDLYSDSSFTKLVKRFPIVSANSPHLIRIDSSNVYLEKVLIQNIPYCDNFVSDKKVKHIRVVIQVSDIGHLGLTSVEYPSVAESVECSVPSKDFKACMKYINPDTKEVFYVRVPMACS